MSDYPNSLFDSAGYGMLSTTGMGSFVGDAARQSGGTTGGGSFNANLIVYIPMCVALPVTVYGVIWNTQTAAGNVDIGLYDIEGKRLGNIGSTALVSSTLQSVNFSTAISINPGVYYGAVQQSSGSSFVQRLQTTTTMTHAAGMQFESGGSFGLPVTWTIGSTSIQAQIPFVGYAINSTF